MANWNISANASAPLVNGLPSGVDNDHGTIRGGGKDNDPAKWSSDPVSLGYHRYVTVTENANYIQKSLTAGTFNGGDDVIRKVTTDLAGVSNDVLKYGASNSANISDSIKSKVRQDVLMYATAIRNNKWDEYNGVFTSISVATSGAWDQTTDSDQASNMRTNRTDNAAHPTKTVPGELVYRDGSATPKQDQYNSRSIF